MNPLYILIPTTLCTSFSFLLPVSNPPNAVVYAYGHITIMDMVGPSVPITIKTFFSAFDGTKLVILLLLLQVKAGLGVNVIGLLSVLLAVGTWGIPLFSLDSYPDWAPVLPNFNSTTP